MTDAIKCEYCHGNIVNDDYIPHCNECGRVPKKYHDKARKIIAEEQALYDEEFKDNDSVFKKQLKR